VPIAACYLEGEALIWFQKASDFATWEEFVEALQVRFLQEGGSSSDGFP
jgi:hypothetical protein